MCYIEKGNTAKHFFCILRQGIRFMKELMRYRSNNILALIPPGKDGELILQQALFFQKTLNMRVFVYNIIQKPSLLKEIFHPKKNKTIRMDSLNALREFILKIAPPEALDQLTYRIKTGNPLRVLLRQSKKGGYEFIIIEKSPSGSKLTPEETNKLISHSHSPVMVINKEFQIKDIKHIVIPVDILQSTKKKLYWATYFAKKFKTKITIVSALSINIDTRQSVVWRNSQKLKHMLTQRGIECDIEIIKAKGQEKHEVILNYIKKVKPGLVIIRTHQESRMAGTRIGKLVTEIMYGCPMPVFTVNRFMYPMPVDFEI